MSERPGLLDRVWAWETQHPVRAYVVYGTVSFAILFLISYVALGVSMGATLGFTLPISFVSPILRYLTIAGWRGAPRPARWGNDKRYYRGPLR